jgi:hypothetical protein
MNLRGRSSAAFLPVLALVVGLNMLYRRLKMNSYSTSSRNVTMFAQEEALRISFQRATNSFADD